MTKSKPSIGLHLIEAIIANAPSISIEGDANRELLSQYWSIVTGLQALASRERGGVKAALNRQADISDVIANLIPTNTPAQITRDHVGSDLLAVEEQNQVLLTSAELELAQAGTILNSDNLSRLCEWEAADLTRLIDQYPEKEDDQPALISAELMTKYLRDHFKEDGITVTACEQLRGGFGKETHIFSVNGKSLSGEFVLRRDMAVELVTNACHKVDKEFTLIEAVRNRGFKTPDVIFVDTEHKLIPGGDFFIMRRSPGVCGGDLFGATEKPDESLNDVLGATIAQLHAMTPLLEVGELTESIRPNFWDKSMKEVVTSYLTNYRDMLFAQPHAPSPASAAIFNWLLANVPDTHMSPCLIHGDIGFHNMLLVQGKLEAVLDWEFAHVGHPAEDLAYCYNAGAADLDWPRVMRAYEAEGGSKIAEKDFLYFRIMMFARNLISTNLAPSRLLNGDVADLRLLSGEFYFRPYILRAIGGLINQVDSLND